MVQKSLAALALLFSFESMAGQSTDLIEICSRALIDPITNYTWLPVFPRTGPSFFVQSTTKEKRFLPEGWSPVTWQPISGGSAWQRVKKSKQNEINYVNLGTGELLFPSVENGGPRIWLSEAFHDGLAAVQTDTGSAILTESGTLIPTEMPITWSHLAKVQHGFFVGTIKDSSPTQPVYIDRNGKVRIPKEIHVPGAGHGQPRLLYLYDFAQNGLAAFTVGTVFGDYRTWRSGYIGTDLKVRISPNFTIARKFKDGAAWVLSGAKWGQILEDGSWKIPPQFDGEPFQAEGSPYFVVRPYGRAPKIYDSVTGHFLFDLPSPTYTGPPTEANGPSGQAVAITSNVLGEVSFIDTHLLTLGYTDGYRIFDLRNRKFLSEVAEPFRVNHKFVNGIANISFYKKKGSTTYGLGSGFIDRSGRILLATPHSGPSVIWDDNGDGQSVKDFLRLPEPENRK